jgi:hypothetical protein
VQPSLRFLLNRFAEWNCELSADANSNFYRLKCFCHCLLSRAHKAGEMGKKVFQSLSTRNIKANESSQQGSQCSGFFSSALLCRFAEAKIHQKLVLKFLSPPQRSVELSRRFFPCERFTSSENALGWKIAVALKEYLRVDRRGGSVCKAFHKACRWCS